MRFGRERERRGVPFLKKENKKKKEKMMEKQQQTITTTTSSGGKKIIRNAKSGNEYAIFSSEDNQPIGRGSFATVWKGLDEKSKETVAIKEMSTKGLQPKLRGVGVGDYGVEERET